MPNPFQQKARQRKIVYLGLIVALFTVSLLHRKLVVEREAEALQLREAARGEVELTSSFVRLSLTGSRGLATTLLWSTAIDRMMKHEWNELELIVNSISKVQPYFITPWIFQSWNLAFNVAVECDRPHDKYYYVSRGLQLLAEGERRNQGTYDTALPGQTRFPGNPEMRHYVGFFYQLKIGNSDEKTTMRSLLDLSAIDPLRRNPDRFWIVNERGQRAVNLDELARLCQDHPRLVRRLREGLGYDTPGQVVKFLEANRDVPSRFKLAIVAGQKESELEEPRKQFPVLPPVTPRRDWPDAKAYQLTPEAFDVFLVCRTWYQYAQEPLPPANPDTGVPEAELRYAQAVERLRKEKNIAFRNSKVMAEQIFRGYPSRAQAYIAENLESEGWFDEEGWLIQGWFDRGGTEEEMRVGTEARYHAAPAWDRAYRDYLQYGTVTGLYLSPADRADLKRKARAIEKLYKVAEFETVPSPSPQQRAQLGASYNAHVKLATNAQLRHMTNYDNLLYQSEGEADAETVLARKLTHQALRYNRKDQHEALPLYEKAWPLWVEVWMRYPRFARSGYVQDDIYEAMLRYLRLAQRQRPEVFRATLLGMAQMATWPYPNWEKWGWIDSSQRAKIVNVRIAHGPLEAVAYYDGPDVEAMRDYWYGVTHVASQLGQLGTAPPVPVPGQIPFALAGGVSDRRVDTLGPWSYLLETRTIDSVRDRLGLRTRPETPPAGPPMEKK